jgi:2-polyprenyl-3-methyl-5-hydroxy-6-metoxy-1,4-benzoquinol methylase
MDANIFLTDKKLDNYYSQDRQDILKYCPCKSKTILDVGCGSGNFGRMLKSQKDIEVWGVELSSDAAEEARTKIDKIIVGDIEEDNLNLPAHYFDCIFFNDVLEHLKYPWNVLKKCKIFLHPHGYIVASIPNVRYYPNIKNLLVAKSWDYADEGVLDKTHLRFFTKKTIEDMFDLCGYHIVAIEGTFECRLSRKIKVLNFLLRHSLDDMKYQRFVVLAQ